MLNTPDRDASEQAAREVLYGSEFLPLKSFDVITMITDTVEGTLRYLVNGMDAGIAFGPPGSGAICELSDGKAPFASGSGTALFPSCSLTNDKQVWSRKWWGIFCKQRAMSGYRTRLELQM